MIKHGHISTIVRRPDSDHAFVAPSRNVDLVFTTITLTLTWHYFVEFGVHEHDLEVFDFFNVHVACFRLKFPDASHFVA